MIKVILILREIASYQISRKEHFIDTLPFMDTDFHFQFVMLHLRWLLLNFALSPDFLDKIYIEEHHTGNSQKILLVNAEREVIDLLNLFQEPQKLRLSQTFEKIIVHISFSKKLEIKCIFF